MSWFSQRSGGGAGGAATGVANAQNFKYTVQGGDGSDFTVTLPAARADANYRIMATLVDVVAHVTMSFPVAGRTTSQFNCVTSGAVTAGDTIEFLVVDNA